VLVALIGFPVMGFFITAPTLLQSGVNDQYRGRIFGAFSTTNALMMLGGLGLASLLGDRLGVVSTLNIVAVLYFLAGIVALALLGRTSNTHGVPAPRG
jgi:MFS family permease